MKWNEYPAGADLEIFGGDVRLWVYRNAGKWEAIIYLHQPDNGIRIIATAKTKKACMNKVESWVKQQAKEILAHNNDILSTYTVQKCRMKDNKLYGPIHASNDGNFTLCGHVINEHWWVLTNDNTGEITCNKCSELESNIRA